MAHIVLLDSTTNGLSCSYCGFPVWREAVTKRTGDNNARQTHYHVACGLLAGLVNRDEVLAWYADGHAKVDEFAADTFVGRLGAW